MEITCPKCKYSRTVADDKVPANAVNATCPQCGDKFRFRELDFQLAEPAPVAPAAETAAPVRETAQPQAPAQPQEAPAQTAPAAETPAPRPEQPQQPAPDTRPVRNIGVLEEDPLPDLDKVGRGGHDIWQRLEELGDTHPGRSGQANATGAPVVEVPFESLDQFGFFGGLWETGKRTVTAPRLFFETMPVDRGYARPATFYVLLNVIAIMLQMTVEFALHGVQLPPGAELPTGVSSLTAGAAMSAAYLFAFVAGPIVITIFLFCLSGVLHLLLTPLQAVSGGFQGTVRAVSYTALPSLCLGIPVVGIYIGSVWSIVLLVYALRGVHKTSFPKAGIAVVLYTLLGLALLSYLQHSMPVPGM